MPDFLDSYPDEAVVDRLFSPYGGICTEKDNWVFTNTLADLQGFCPFLVQILDNDNFNAVAIKHKRDRLVGIFRGMLQIIHLNMRSIISDPLISPHVPAFDDIAIGDEGWHAVWRIMGLKSNEINVASALSICIEIFVLFHEAAHLANGHMEILKDRYGLDTYDEFLAVPQSPEEAALRRALECDADNVAALSSLSLWRTIYSTNHYSRFMSPISADESWIFAVTSFFYMAEFLGRQKNEMTLSTHPSMSARLLSVLIYMTNETTLDKRLVFAPMEQPFFMDSVKFWSRRYSVDILGKRQESVLTEIVELHEALKILSPRLIQRRKDWERFRESLHAGG